MSIKVLLSVLATGVLIQFVPYGKDHQNPPVLTQPQWDSMQTRELFERACANCHSHETVYPWYSDIAPISWLITRDVEEGREHFNISTLGIQKKNKIKDAATEVREGEMPPFFYLPLHPEAKLSDADKETLAKGLENTFGKEEKH
jgi:cytochrome c551/c552